MELNLKRFKILIVVFLVLCIVAAIVVPTTSYFMYGGRYVNFGFNYTLITNLGYEDTSFPEGFLTKGTNYPKRVHKGVLHTELLVPALILEYVILLLLFAGLTFVIAVKKRMPR